MPSPRQSGTSLRLAEAFGEFGQHFAFECKEGVEVGRRQPRRIMKIEARRIIHAAFAAALRDVAFDEPLHQPVVILVALGEIPFQIGREFRIVTAPTQAVSGCHRIDELDAICEHRWAAYGPEAP